MSIICPKCLADMSEIQIQGVTVDLCPGCRGIWLDPGELAQLRDASEDLPFSAEGSASENRDSISSTFICPRCQGSFDTLEYAPDTRLYIDRCRDCRGIYLDAGELKKVREITGRRLLKLQTHTDPNRALAEAMARERSRQRLQPRIATAGKGVYFFQLLTGLPVEVDAKRARFPAVTLALILINALVFLYQLLAVGESRSFYETYAFIPGLLWREEGLLGLFTSMFLHGGVVHILGNMYFLWVFGDNVEDRLNRGLFLFFYLFCGILASLIHAAATNQPEMPTLGASGAISGVMGAYLVLYPRRRMYQILFFYQFRVSVTFYLLFWLGLQVIFSGMGLAGVAWFAHIGGFLAGALGMWMLRLAGMVRPDPYAAASA